VATPHRGEVTGARTACRPGRVRGRARGRRCLDRGARERPSGRSGARREGGGHQPSRRERAVSRPNRDRTRLGSRDMSSATARRGEISLDPAPQARRRPARRDA